MKRALTIGRLIPPVSAAEDRYPIGKTPYSEDANSALNSSLHFGERQRGNDFG